MPVQLLMMPTAERHREFIIYFRPQGPKLRNLEMARIARAHLEARLRSDIVELGGLDQRVDHGGVLARINDHNNQNLHQLLPWNWKPTAAAAALAA